MINQNLVRMLQDHLKMAESGAITDAVLVGANAATGTRNCAICPSQDAQLEMLAWEVDLAAVQMKQIVLQKRAIKQQQGGGIIPVRSISGLPPLNGAGQ